MIGCDPINSTSDTRCHVSVYGRCFEHMEGTLKEYSNNMQIIRGGQLAIFQLHFIIVVLKKYYHYNFNKMFQKICNGSLIYTTILEFFKLFERFVLNKQSTRRTRRLLFLSELTTTYRFNDLLPRIETTHCPTTIEYSASSDVQQQELMNII